MKFWAIAYQFDEDSFYDFATNEDTYDLKVASCQQKKWPKRLLKMNYQFSMFR